MQPNDKRMRLLLLLVLLGATAIFYWRIWTPNPADRLVFEGDIYEKDYPQRVAWMRIVAREGRLPFWNPYEFGGWPALANCEMGVLYPPHWLLFLGAGPEGSPTYFALELLVLGHFVLAGWGMLLLLRRYGLSAGPALLGALVYAFCGFHGGHKLHVNMFFTIVWFPFIFYWIEGALKQKQPRLLLAAAPVLAVACLAGHPQMFYYMVLLIGGRLVWQTIAEILGGERLSVGVLQLGCRSAAVLAPALAIASVQIFPSLELFEYTARAGAGTYAFASEFSLPPVELAEFLLPSTFPWFFIEVFYVGVWVWPLAWVALRWSGRFRESPAWTFWWAVFAFGLLMALGDYAGLFPAGYFLVPGMSRVRAPSRWMYFVNMALAILAAGGLEVVLRSVWESEEQGKRVCRRLRRVVRWLVLLLLLGIFYLHVEGMKPFPQVHLQNLKRMAGDMTLVVVFLSLGWLLVMLFEQNRLRNRGLAIGLCLLVFLDLATHNSQINVTSTLPDDGPAAAVKRLRIDPETTPPFRFWALPEARWRVNGNLYGLEEAGGHSPLAPVDYLEALERAVQGRLEVFRQQGVRYVYQIVPVSLKGILEDTGDGLWRVPRAFPRVYAVEDVVPVDSEEIRMQLVHSTAWNHRRLAWVDRIPDEFRFEETQSGFPLPLLIRSAAGSGEWSRLVLDGKSVAEASRGYYLAVMDAAGRVEKEGVFDLEQDRGAAGRLVELIRSVPDGRWVAGFRGGGAAQMEFPEEVFGAFSILGLSAKEEGRPVQAHAFLGRKGGVQAGGAMEPLEAVSGREAVVVVGARTGRGYAMRTEDHPVQPESVHLLEYGAGFYRVKAPGVERPVLVVLEKNYPGWRAKGASGFFPVVEANRLALAVFGPDKGGEIDLWFLPVGWWWWVLLCGVGLGVSLTGWWSRWPDRLNERTGCWFPVGKGKNRKIELEKNGTPDYKE